MPAQAAQVFDQAYCDSAWDHLRSDNASAARRMATKALRALHKPDDDDDLPGTTSMAVLLARCSDQQNDENDDQDYRCPFHRHEDAVQIYTDAVARARADGRNDRVVFSEGLLEETRARIAVQVYQELVAGACADGRNDRVDFFVRQLDQAHARVEEARARVDELQRRKREEDEARRLSKLLDDWKLRLPNEWPVREATPAWSVMDHPRSL
ncbi:uncharacterized protein BKA78DRAFT_381437 [Phyllosticta capitalensis]|uniref:uncharacterized protein n=1 Tax=Phyllosticta capitalensis TaxID=121624 RepID=UPI00312E781A